MARQPRKASVEKQSSFKSLMDALAFAKNAYDPDGENYAKHVVLYGKFLYAYNGIVGVCHPVEDDFTACPQADLLVQALSKCKDTVALAVANRQLAITSGKLSVKVPCVDLEDMMPIQPDPMVIPCGQELVSALSAVGILVDEKQDDVLHCSVLLRDNVCVSTDRHTAIEATHGVRGIPDMVLPKMAITMLARSPQALVGIGGSANSITFHFANGAWMKTQLYTYQYPPVEKVLKFAPPTTEPVKGFFDGVEAIGGFADETTILFDKDEMRCGQAAYKFEGFGCRFGFNHLKLRKIKGLAKFVQYVPDIQQLWFASENVKGCVMALNIASEDDDVPF